jgi:N-acetylneuraminic acid mutarotase
MKKILACTLMAMSFFSCKKELLERQTPGPERTGVVVPAPQPAWSHMTPADISPFVPGPGNNACFEVNNTGYCVLSPNFMETYKFQNNQWTQVDNFVQLLVGYKFLFSHGTKIYLGLRDDAREILSIDVVTRQVATLANFPGDVVNGVTVFKVGTTAYLAGGHAFGSSASSRKLWKYDILNNTWTSEGDMGCGSRAGATAFVLNGKVYFGLGKIMGGAFVAFMDDWWEFTPTTKTWVQKANFPGGKRVGVQSFVINGAGYAGWGQNSNNNNINDLWSYNPASNSWYQKPSWPGTYNADIGTFTISDRFYLVKGEFQQFSRYAIAQLEVN